MRTQTARAAARYLDPQPAPPAARNRAALRAATCRTQVRPRARNLQPVPAAAARRRTTLRKIARTAADRIVRLDRQNPPRRPSMRRTIPLWSTEGSPVMGAANRGAIRRPHPQDCRLQRFHPTERTAVPIARRAERNGGPVRSRKAGPRALPRPWRRGRTQAMPRVRSVPARSTGSGPFWDLCERARAMGCKRPRGVGAG